MRINWKKLLLCIAIPLAVGGVAALLSGGMGETYQSYVRPPLSPPGWVFGVVWPILYALMGYASYLVVEAEGNKKPPLLLYGAQLLVNFLWPIVFFRFQWFWAAFVVLLGLWLLIFLTMQSVSVL